MGARPTCVGRGTSLWGRVERRFVVAWHAKLAKVIAVFLEHLLDDIEDSGCLFGCDRRVDGTTERGKG